MIKLIRLSILSLILGVLVLSIGAWGSLSASADTIKETSTILFQGLQIAVFVGGGLIIVSGIFFVAALLKAKE